MKTIFSGVAPLGDQDVHGSGKPSRDIAQCSYAILMRIRNGAAALVVTGGRELQLW